MLLSYGKDRRIDVTLAFSDRESRIESLIKEVSTKYDDLQECKYQLHAVFIHQGELVSIK